jgi:hypothetical protein
VGRCTSTRPWLSESRDVTDLAALHAPAGIAARAQTVVLVEGMSDKLALRALAQRRGRDLDAEGVAILAMGGSKNIRQFLDVFGPRGFGLRVAGLCDVGEERDFRRGLEHAGFGSNLTRSDLAVLGFHVCVADLEDELIRALGADAVEEVVASQGELAALRTFQRQPQWAARSHEEQLRRFLGTHSGRKIECAPLLVHALDLDRVPAPLDRLLAQL